MLLLGSLSAHAQYSYQEQVYQYDEDLLETNIVSVYLGVDSSFQEKYKGADFDYSAEYVPLTKDSKGLNYFVDSLGSIKLDSGKIEPIEYRRSVQIDGFGEGFFKFILVLILAGLLFLLFRVLSNFKVNRREKAEKMKLSDTEADSGDPEELEEEDLKTRLQAAIREQNYPLAVRYYFLLYLEKLERNKIIEYHADRTNLDYLKTIGNEKTADQFVSLSYLFEYVWYGKKPLDTAGFMEVEKIFTKHLNS